MTTAQVTFLQYISDPGPYCETNPNRFTTSCSQDRQAAGGTPLWRPLAPEALGPLLGRLWLRRNRSERQNDPAI